MFCLVCRDYYVKNRTQGLVLLLHTGVMTWMRDMNDAYIICGWISVGKIPLWRPRHRWEDNIKYGETGCEGADRILLTHCRIQRWGFVNTVMNFRVQNKGMIFFTVSQEHCSMEMDDCILKIVLYFHSHVRHPAAYILRCKRYSQRNACVDCTFYIVVFYATAMLFHL
jgi:hypothetical protein